MRMVLVLLAFMAVLLPASSTAAELLMQTDGHPSLEAINAAWQSGEITLGEALLYRLYFVKDHGRLPERFRIEAEPIKCGTLILMEVYEQAENLPVAIREEIENYRARPSLPYYRDTQHFRIHYAIGGYNGVPDEAWVDVVAEACEVSWQAFHVARDWKIPPSDGGMGGGAGLIDCYIHNLGSGILGMAEPENPVPGDPPWDFTGYFHVNNTITSANQRRATVAHEYMHVVQFGYYGYMTFAWYMENCAMMGEEYAYDTINDYRGYLSGFFSVPYKSLRTHNGVYEYGQIVWPMYQGERFEEAAVEAIWDRAQWLGNAFTAHDEALATYGYDLHSAYGEFMRWCFYTNQRDDGNHFEEGGTWSAMLYPNLTITSYPSGDREPSVNMRPEAIGTSVMRFNRQSGSDHDDLIVNFNGPDCTLCVDLIAKTTGVNVWTEYSMTLNSSGDGTITIPGFSNSEYVFMLSSMHRSCNTAQNYVFSARTEEGGAGDVADGTPAAKVRIHPSRPNPFALRTSIAFALPAESQVGIRILDASGRLVRDLYSGRHAAGEYEVSWDGRTDEGQDAGNGVYFARILVNGEETVRKMTVVR